MKGKKCKLEKSIENKGFINIPSYIYNLRNFYNKYEERRLSKRAIKYGNYGKWTIT